FTSRPRGRQKKVGRPSGRPFYYLPRFFLGAGISSCSQRQITPPITPPRIGATQNSQSECQASGPPKIAVAVERAGLTEAFDTGMAIRWISVSASPIAIGAKPTGALRNVEPTITTRNIAVQTTSVIAAEASENPCAPP